MLGTITATLKANTDVLFGAAGGYFLSGKAISLVQNATGSLFSSASLGKWLGVAASLVVAGIAVGAGNKLGKAKLGVAFAGVTLGQGIAAGISAAKG